MALIDKLNAIADAIREKTGKEDKMTLSQMPDEISGITTADGGVTLPELENPASATDLASGKQLIGADGGIVTGTLPESGEGVNVMVAGDVGISGTAGNTSFTPFGFYQPNKVGDNTVGFIMRPGTQLAVRNVPTSLLGNASADQVVKGATFTSEAGYLVEGTMETDGGLSITDDGAGNVSIESFGTISISDDGAGNVTIE